MPNERKLPDAYYKKADGNNYKILHLNELATGDFSKDLSDVLNSLDLMQATGKTLDMYGAMVEQSRGALNDTQYRMMILNKIGKNICQGDYNSVLQLLSQSFNCTPSDIILEESKTDVCGVEIVKFPLDILIEAGFSSSQAVQLIERLLPAGVKISDGNFEGTFEFGEANYFNDMLELDYDELAGFADEAQTIGGYLGLLVGDTNGFDLPT